jgi:hypothetical protein
MKKSTVSVSGSWVVIRRLARGSALACGLAFVLAGTAGSALAGDPCAALPNGGKVTIKVDGPRLDPACVCGLPLPPNAALGYSDGSHETCEFKVGGRNTGQCKQATSCPPGTQRRNENGTVKCISQIDKEIDCKAPPAPAIPKVDPPKKLDRPAVDPRFLDREKNAPAAVRDKVTEMRKEVESKGGAFAVAVTSMFGVPLPKATGYLANPAADQAFADSGQAWDAAAGLRAAAEVEKCAGADSYSAYDGRTAPAAVSQGQCGSCWAFATTAAMEASLGDSVVLSKQQAVDCSGYSLVGRSIDPGSCNGGNHEILLAGLRKGGSLFTDGTFPYAAADKACAMPSSGARYTVEAWGRVPPQVGIMKRALCKFGPLATAMVADDQFQAYAGGVYAPTRPTAPLQTNHVVTIVGWQGDAWVIRNSWGGDWGEGHRGATGGYARVKQNTANLGLGTTWVKAKAVP